MSPSTFPDAGGFIVDGEAAVGNPRARRGEVSRGAVSVVGSARFKSVKTGKGWDEQFIYRFSDFDEDGRIGHWEIWADPLSAWDAVGD